MKTIQILSQFKADALRFVAYEAVFFQTHLLQKDMLVLDCCNIFSIGGNVNLQKFVELQI